MPVSEIDDIFASKASSSKVSLDKKPEASSSTSTKQKKKKSSKRKRTEQPALSEEPSSVKKQKSDRTRPPPEEILDTSNTVESTKPKNTKPPKPPKRAADQAPFNDSRGTSSRRKTEEGWSVFKEDELGIDPEKGDTPLCPFDCDCCF